MKKAATPKPDLLQPISNSPACCPEGAYHNRSYGADMSFKNVLLKLLNKILGKYHYKACPQNLLYPWQHSAKVDKSQLQETNLPVHAKSYLNPANPRLLELQERYARFQKATESFIWTPDYIKAQDLLYFRGDNGYIWQSRGNNMNEMSYTLAYYYVKSIDSLDLLSNLSEDKWFGNITFQLEGKLVSRDLLDSILEIYFLHKHLDLFSSAVAGNILDIGAGYGRLAHRLLRAFPNIKTCFCTDAVAISTFICEYYLKFRNLEEKAVAVPLHQIESVLKENKIDIALNIHSFSECSKPAIEWWLDKLQRSGIPFLLVIPNPMNHGGKHLLTTEGLNFTAIIKQHGYDLASCEPKYNDPLVQKYAMAPTYYYLFKSRDY
jgi:hypothetical protein